MTTFNSAVKKILTEARGDYQFKGWPRVDENKPAIDSLISAYIGATSSHVDPAAPVKDKMSKITQGDASRARQIASEIDNIIRYDTGTDFGDHQAPDIDALRSIHTYIVDYIEGISGEVGY